MQVQEQPAIGGASVPGMHQATSPIHLQKIAGRVDELKEIGRRYRRLTLAGDAHQAFVADHAAMAEADNGLKYAADAQVAPAKRHPAVIEYCAGEEFTKLGGQFFGRQIVRHGGFYRDRRCKPHYDQYALNMSPRLSRA